MADKLADELLHMILAPSLTIPHDQFVSPSPTAFGENDNVSTASVLLVCKRWLRVATPLLYESAVIRSTGQSHALAVTFRQNPAFTRYVKKVRLEGAFTSLKDILMKCRNLKTLVIILRVFSDANVTGLCRVLPSINPTNVVLSDQWQTDNAKLRRVFLALCESIPKWSNLTTFEYPYHAPGYGTATVMGSNLTRRERLITALAESKSLRVISCEIPGAHVNSWQRLASIPSVNLKFRYRSDFPLHLAVKKVILDDIKRSRLSDSSLEFVDISKPPPPHALKVIRTPALPVCPATVHIWTKIFLFATQLGGHDFSNLICGRGSTNIALLFPLNFTRKALSLVCKSFQRIVRPMFFISPLIFKASSLHQFVEKVLSEPLLGRQVRALFMAGLYNNDVVEQDLCALFPHLDSLRHYVGCESHMLPYISTKAFTLLARAAGSTLLTITNLFICNGDEPLSPSVLNLFKRLIRLDVVSRPRVLKNVTDMTLHSLSTLRDLRLRGPSELLEIVCTLSLPNLRSMTFHSVATPTMEIFMYKYGRQLEELCFQGSADLSDVLINAPNLCFLRWTPQDPTNPVKDSMNIRTSLNKYAEHKNLRAIALKGIPNTENTEAEQMKTIGAFFSSIDLARFPSMREIHFVSYDWPVEGRAILKDPLPKIAVQMKDRYGVDIKDRSGKPWRQRVQKRR